MKNKKKLKQIVLEAAKASNKAQRELAEKVEQEPTREELLKMPVVDLDEPKTEDRECGHVFDKGIMSNRFNGVEVERIEISCQPKTEDRECTDHGCCVVNGIALLCPTHNSSATGVSSSDDTIKPTLQKKLTGNWCFKEEVFWDECTCSPKQDTWEEKVKISNHEWVVRLIKMGQANIPKAGFYVFENPYLEAIIRSELQKQRQEIIEKIKEKGETHKYHGMCSYEVVIETILEELDK